nr:MAG TPA: hypothetical protein [Caudoviricetes sp.]
MNDRVLSVESNEFGERALLMLTSPSVRDNI